MIIFQKIKYKNILSTGNTFTILDLNKYKSTLILGDNGSGKSTFLDALSFGLYGRPFRKINKPQLINSINGKNLLVEIEFKIGKHQYLIRRGIKPNIFEIHQNGKLIDQDASSYDYQDYLEKHILKLTHKSFSQIVVLGSSTFVPFMQLTANHRREVIEDLLDLQVFSTMNILLKEKIQENEDILKQCNYKLDVIKEKIKLTKQHIVELNADKKIRIENTKQQIGENHAQIQDLQEQISVYNEEIDALKNQIKDQDNIQQQLNKLNNVELELKNNIKELQLQIDFFNENDQCPTCRQDIDKDFKQSELENKNHKFKKTSDNLDKAGQLINKCNEQLSAINDVQKQIQNIQTSISENTWQIENLQNINNKLSDEISKNTNVEIDNTHLEKFNSELKLGEKAKQSLSNKRNTLQVISVILKDTGIKTKIIKQYIPIMNKLINKHLAAMEFFVQFELDEAFNETIKSRYRDDFTYASFSEGEKMRIDLALLFTWRSIARIRNSTSTNLLIMDEVFDSSLDDTGTDEFMKILNELTSDNNSYIISHRGDQLIDKFDNTIRFKKIKNFSQIIG